MAAPATQIDTTSVAEVIPTEEIGNWIDGYNYPMTVGLLVAAILPGIGSIPMRAPRWDQFSVPAGTKSEGDDMTQVEATTAEESVTPGIVAFEIALTDEVIAGRSGISEATLQECMAALGNRIDVDALSGSTSATNTVGTILRVYNREAFAADVASYRALNIPGGGLMSHAFVGHSDAFRDLDQDNVLTAAQYDVQFESLAAAAGYRGRVGGFQMFESSNVAAETSGWSNFMTPIGAGRSGLMVVVSRGPKVESNRGRDGARAQSTYHAFTAWYGAGLRNRLRIQECLSRT